MCAHFSPVNRMFVSFSACRRENSSKTPDAVGAGVIWPRVQALQERITVLERALKESSKAREQRVRRAPLELRATMAYEMQVNSPTRSVAGLDELCSAAFN